MNILICNERLLFRFGVDRLLLILAENLSKQGHHITFLVNNFNASVVEKFADEVHRIPEGAESYIQLDTFASKWIDKAWDELFWKEKPDLAIIGGWPFFSSIPVFEKHNCRTLFIDCGSVPVDGFVGGALETQLYLKELRKAHLPALSAISPISDFIARTQSSIDAPNVPSQVILLGGDHMARSLWRAEAVNTNTPYTPPQRDYGAPELRIVNLGRWEPGCYKNSEAVFVISSALSRRNIQHKIYVLADPAAFICPPSLSANVYPIGFPDDSQLQELMRSCDVGISVSLWEGFNLPLAEMQWLNKPVLAFDCAAHPEVVVNGWYLCRDVSDMTAKLQELHENPHPLAAKHWIDRSRFHDHFSWDRVASEYIDLISKVATPNISVFVDVSNATKDPANSGVIRVTRRLCRELQRFVEPIFLVWASDVEQYVFPTEAEYRQLAQFNGPIISDSLPRSNDMQRTSLSLHPELIKEGEGWLLLTETIFEKNGKVIRHFCKEKGIKTAAIFYDAIPILRPDYVKDKAIRENHADYMIGLAECDVVIPISQFSADCLQTFWSDQVPIRPSVITNSLPGEFGGSDRLSPASSPVSEEVIRILCVSTLEPRKGHRQILKALRMLDDMETNLKWEITFVGNRYAGAHDLAEEMIRFCRDEPRAKWLGIVDDATLHKEYSTCTFTIYASEIEGFGMPIMESLWHGKPCICHEIGVMAELAREGGCIKTDVRKPEMIARAIYELGTNQDLLQGLMQKASSRFIKTWHDYTTDFVRILYEQSTAAQNGERDHSDATDLRNTISDALSSFNQRDGLSVVGHALLNSLALQCRPGCNIIISETPIDASIGKLYPDQTFFLVSSALERKASDIADNVVAAYGDISISLPTILEELDVRGPFPSSIMILLNDFKLFKDCIEMISKYTPKQPLVFYAETDNREVVENHSNLWKDFGLFPKTGAISATPDRFIELDNGRYIFADVKYATRTPSRTTQ